MMPSGGPQEIAVFLVILSIALLSLAPLAAAEGMYGCGGNGSDTPGVLFLVDETTGAQTEIDDVVTPGGLSGLAKGTITPAILAGSR